MNVLFRWIEKTQFSKLTYNTNIFYLIITHYEVYYNLFLYELYVLHIYIIK